MSTMNSLRGSFASASASIAPYQGQLQLGLYVVVGLFVVYIISTILNPPPDMLEQVVLSDRREANELNGTQITLNPPISSGSEYTFQTWINISNYDYRAGQPKHVFTIGSAEPPAKGVASHVTMIGILYPNENKMMIRVNQRGQKGTPDEPDLTLTKNITDLFRGNLSSNMFHTSLTYPLCDIQNIPLQKWVCLTIVVSGRLVDVYMDGKLSRSCVCPGVPLVDKGAQIVTLGLLGGWGGSISTTRFYGYALTPARAYELYQQGPEDQRGLDKKYGFIGFLAEKLGVRYSYEGL
jgi:hypothetical protein